MSTSEEEKREAFTEVKEAFANVISQTHWEKDDVNICCNESETEFIMKYGDILKSKYPKVTLNDIYVALIFTYYSLNLGEQTTDYLDLADLRDQCIDYNKVKKIFIMLTTSDKSIASAVRRHFFGMTPLIKNSKASISSAYRLTSSPRAHYSAKSTGRGLKKSRRHRLKRQSSKKTRRYRKR
uniref:Uncharacterized protein n=1 Tax=viral metagenome TaxID=1070528 RepID=A0A6C0HCL9_9ZZZZ